MVLVFLADGFEEIEALTSVDVMRRAGIEVKTVGIGKSNITGAHGITVIADISENEALSIDDFDMILLPGGMPGTTNLDNSDTVNIILEKAVKNDTYIAAICAAPMVLGKRNILNGKKAICYPGFEKELSGAIVENSGFVRDGKIITGRAMGSALDFGLELVSVLLSKEISDKIKKSILY